MLWHPPVKRLLDALGHRLLDEVQDIGARRVFIDSLSAIGRAATIPVRMVSFFSALMHELPVRDVTMLASWEIGTCSAATCALGCQSCRG